MLQHSARPTLRQPKQINQFVDTSAWRAPHEHARRQQMLTNAEMDSQRPVLLVGQPTLARQLRLGGFAALDQRIATRYQLAPMDMPESATYLRLHLALVGRTDPLIRFMPSSA